MDKTTKKGNDKSNTDVSLRKIADRLVSATKKIMRSAKTEEELRIGFERALGGLLESAGYDYNARYERLSDKAKSIFKGRPDAVHGQVVIEYEQPGSFSSKRKVEHAYEQLKNYIAAEVIGSRKEKAEGFVRIAGVGFDGRLAFFVRCRPKERVKLQEKASFDFIMDGPHSFDCETAFTFVTYLRALARIALTAENLAERFGPKSQTAQQTVSAFVDALTNWSTRRANVFFNEWQRLFGIVYGETI